MSSFPIHTIYDPSGDVLLVLSKTDDSEPATKSPAKVDKVTPGDEHKQLGLDDGQPTRPDSSDPQTLPPVKEYEFMVSSRHLALASSVFRSMFDGNFKERINPECGSLRRVPLPDDNFDAMLPLLAIVHGRTRAVPRNIDKDLFVDIAVLIDKYGMNECTEVFTDMWFRDLWPLREESPPHLTDWIFLCLVFNHAAEFEELTRKAIFESTLVFEDNELPLPQRVASEIALRRVSTIKAVMRYLEGLLNSYMTDYQLCQCHKNCDAMVLGSLIKGLNAEGLFPLPEADALDMSIKDLFSQLRAMNLASLCQAQFGYAAHNRGLSRKLDDVLSGFESQVSGLDFQITCPGTPCSDSSEPSSQQNKSS